MREERARTGGCGAGEGGMRRECDEGAVAQIWFCEACRRYGTRNAFNT